MRVNVRRLNETEAGDGARRGEMGSESRNKRLVTLA